MVAEPSAEAATLAARLRELKERSGLSYAALARRLHVSTSTLHRYCHGTALPAEFGTVERFARLCGADPRERMALHRLWLLADAARGGPGGASRGQAAPAREAAATPDAPPAPGDGAAAPAEPPRSAASDDAPATAPGTDDVGPGATRPDDAPDATAPEDAPGTAEPEKTTGPEKTTEPEKTTGPAETAARATAPGAPVSAPGHREPTAPEAPAATPPTGAAPPPDTPTDGVTDTAADGVTDTPTDGAAEAPADAPSAAADRPAAPRRRRRVPVVGVVCLAVLVVLTLLASWLWPGGGERSAGSPTGATAPENASPAADEPGRSPSEPRRSPTPSPDDTASSAAPGPSRDDRTGTPSPDRPRDGTAPLRLSVRSHVWENHCDHRYLIDKPPEQVPPPPVEADARAWATAQNAVHGGTTNVEVTVTGVGDAPVVLRALHIRVARRAAPLPWSSYAMDNGCGGALTPASFRVDLDQPRPVARPEAGNDQGEPIPPVTLPQRVTADEPVVLLLRAATEECACSWYAELEWAAGDRSGTVRIDDAGAPFRTSGTAGRPEYGYRYDEQTWYRTDG
mgnify:CR=1 FL=1